MLSDLIDLDYMIRLRRQLHMYPEIGFELPRTLELIRQELDSLGVPYTENYGRSSIVAWLNKGQPGFRLAFRADTDALAIQEENDVPYRSRIDGAMHACGHDVHTAALLGTIKALSQVQDQLAGQVAFLFQAAEEGPGGARLMVADGVAAEFDAIVACHVDNTLDCGSIMARDGVTLASSDYFTIDLFGQAGHAAAPHAAVDALAMGHRLYADLQLLHRELAPTVANVLSVCVMQAGNLTNTIADHCQMAGTIRTHADQAAAHLRQRVEQLALAVAGQYGGRAEARVKQGYGALMSNPLVAARVRAAAKSAGATVVQPLTAPPMYAEDFAYYTREKPAAFFFLGTRNAQKGFTAMTHNSDFDVDEEALAWAARTFVSFALANSQGIAGLENSQGGNDAKN